METMKLRQYVGEDGILHLDIPVGVTEGNVEVMVIYQPVSPPTVTVFATRSIPVTFSPTLSVILLSA